MMEENDITLAQLRNEYQTMKDTLSKQEIINEKLMREIMRSKVRSIRSAVSISVACGIFVMLGAPVIFHYNPVIKASWLFVAGTELLMALCIFFDWKFNHKVQSSDLSCCDILTFNKEVTKLKDHYKSWVKWGLGLGSFWAVWLCKEVWVNSEDPRLACGMIAGILIGLFTGCILGYMLNRKIIHTCDEIVSQIEN